MLKMSQVESINDSLESGKSISEIADALEIESKEVSGKDRFQSGDF